MKCLAILMFLVSTSVMAQTLYAPDGTYLGRVNNNKYDPDSISNPYGTYGNKYSPNSVNNPYGRYGNKYSNQYSSPYGN